MIMYFFEMLRFLRIRMFYSFLVFLQGYLVEYFEHMELKHFT